MATNCRRDLALTRPWRLTAEDSQQARFGLLNATMQHCLSCGIYAPRLNAWPQQGRLRVGSQAPACRRVKQHLLC